MNYIIDNCLVSEYLGGLRIVKDKSTANYPKLSFGSRANDNYVIGLLSDGVIKIKDLTNDTVMKDYLHKYKNGKSIEDCTNPQEIEDIILELSFEVNDANFAKLPIGTLKILKIFLNKGYKLNAKSYEIIKSDVFCDEEYYETIQYLHNNNYELPNYLLKDLAEL